MSVEKQQTMAAAAPQCERGSEQDAAVAAEHDRELTTVENRLDSVGKPGRVLAQAARIEHSGLRIDPRVVVGDGQPTRAARAQPLREPCGQQGIGHRFDSRGPQAKMGRRFDNRKHSQQAPACTTHDEASGRGLRHRCLRRFGKVHRHVLLQIDAKLDGEVCTARVGEAQRASTFVASARKFEQSTTPSR
jgi:hypothetical protein